MTSSQAYGQAESRRRHVVFAGGGLAAFRGAEELRKRGFDGEVTILSAENVAPYDRPPLSKSVLVGSTSVEDTIYRGADFYQDQNVNLLLNHKATGLDVRERVVKAGGKLIDYTDLVICTGGAPRRLNTMGRLQGIYELRTIGDAIAVRQALLERPRVVVFGAGFIGAEVAASARALGLEVTIVGTTPVPLHRAIGLEMGRACSGLHGEFGTRLLLDVSIEAIEGRDRVERIRLSDGSRVDCDLLVVGIGVVPSVDWLEGSGVELNNGVVCDAHLRASVPGIYAAGDVASWYNTLFNQRTRGEQWTNAVEQGRYIARGIASGTVPATPYCSSNYFWSDQYGIKIQFAGIPDGEEIVVVDGAVESRKFIAWYRSGDRLVGALAMDSAKLLMFSKVLIDRRTSWRDAVAALEKQQLPPSAAQTEKSLI